MLTERIMKVSSRSKIFISALVVIIVGTVTYRWAVWPQTSHLHAAQQHKMMMENAGKKTTVIKNGVHVKKTQRDQLNEEIAEIERNFFTSKIANEFFLDLEPMAVQCGCDIGSFNFMPAQTIDFDQEHGHSFDIVARRAKTSLTGGYDGIIKFLRKLGSYSQRIAIGELDIEAVDGNVGELACSMTITIYVIEDKENPSNE